MPACSVGRVIVIAALISGALAGLAGAGEVGGVRFQVTSDLSSGYGYAGIVIATLAELNPLGAVPAALFFAIIFNGAGTMARATGVPIYLADVIQGVALVCMVAGRLFATYRLRLCAPLPLAGEGRGGGSCSASAFPLPSPPPQGGRDARRSVMDLLATLLDVGFFAAMVRIATPLILATLGELYSRALRRAQSRHRGHHAARRHDRLHRRLFHRQSLARRRRGAC